MKLLVASITNVHLMGHRNKICLLPSCLRDSPDTSILAWWKKHWTTRGKTKELAQIDGIIIFPLVPISNTFKTSREENRRGAVAVMLAVTESSARETPHVVFCSHTDPVQLLFTRGSDLWLCSLSLFHKYTFLRECAWMWPSNRFFYSTKIPLSQPQWHNMSLWCNTILSPLL